MGGHGIGMHSVIPYEGKTEALLNKRRSSVAVAGCNGPAALATNLTHVFTDPLSFFAMVSADFTMSMCIVGAP
jgi:hypothetical protein